MGHSDNLSEVHIRHLMIQKLCGMLEYANSL